MAAVESEIGAEGMGKLLRAVEFAIRKHDGQRRKASDEPFVVHPVGVAHLLCKIADVKDCDVLCAAVLHDVVEDTAATLEDIERVFGKKTAGIVAEVSDDRTLSQRERKRAQLAGADHKSYGAALVKMADMIYNIADLMRAPPPGWTAERVQGYCVWKRAIAKKMGVVNPALSLSLEALLGTSTFVIDGVKHPAIPDGEDLDAFLERYLQSCSQKKP